MANRNAENKWDCCIADHALRVNVDPALRPHGSGSPLQSTSLFVWRGRDIRISDADASLMKPVRALTAISCVREPLSHKAGVSDSRHRYAGTSMDID
ncbi:uncharacterized protein LOC133530248 isoform X2 [Cydia pomonella]|nr:uncharacterized protein LOC133530248 isoform X2 [Cydia pomonella]